jgi:hypothetical protein
MCKRISKTTFETKTGIPIEVKFPSNVDYICAMSIKYISDMNFRVVIPIEKHHWEDDLCVKQ